MSNAVTTEVLFMYCPHAVIFPRASICRLSLSQRERMKVRDCLCGSPPRRTRLLAEHCRVLGEPDDSKIARLRIPDARGTRLDHDLVCDRLHSCGRRRQAQQQVWRQDSRNPKRKGQSDAAGEIFIHQNFDCAGGAKECAHILLSSSEDNGNASRIAKFTESPFRKEVNLCVSSRYWPLTSILSQRMLAHTNV
jgi:hypothetical protein